MTKKPLTRRELKKLLQYVEDHESDEAPGIYSAYSSLCSAIPGLRGFRHTSFLYKTLALRDEIGREILTQEKLIS